MRARTFALAALLALLAVAAASGQELEFKQFASGDGRYKAQFPGTVKTASAEVGKPRVMRLVVASASPSPSSSSSAT